MKMAKFRTSNTFIYLFILLILSLNACISTEIKPYPIEKQDASNIKMIKIISNLEPVYTDMVYMAMLRFKKYKIAEKNEDLTFYFTNSRIEYHGLSLLTLLTAPFSKGDVKIYYHKYFFTVKVLSREKKILYIFDNEIIRRDTNPKGGLTEVELTKIIWDTMSNLDKIDDNEKNKILDMMNNLFNIVF